MAYIQSITTTENQTYDIKSKVTAAIPYGECDSTSTSTAFTATVDGITALYDGVTVLLKNGVVTSASGFTININGLGAKPVYNNMETGNDITPTAPTRDTTIFNINYTMLLVYSSDIVSGGGWICYRGYDANTNTIGYQLRTNSTVMTVTDTARYYKLYFTSANGKQWVPASVDSTNNTTSARAVNQRPIDPFGRIVYTSANTNYAAGANLAATTIWDQYVLALGYSFNRTGAALTLTLKEPVYVKCAPQTNGSAIMDADTPIVQTLPSTKDGKIYIFLGVAYSATNIELYPNHPVYWHDGTGIRLWTGAEASSGGIAGVDLNTSAEPYSLPLANNRAILDIGDGLAVSDSSGVTLKHKTGAGYNHIPSGGTSGQYLGYSSNGTASWQTPPTVAVDSALSSTSENPVQNKVINTALNGKVDKTYTCGTLTNTVDSGDYGLYVATADSSTGTSGSVGTTSAASGIYASNSSGIYGLEATTTGVQATFTDSSSFETTTLFDFAAMTETEIADAVDSGWGGNS